MRDPWPSRPPTLPRALPIAIFALLPLGSSLAGEAAGAEVEARSGLRPNVLLVITDDQGYGDVAAHGNPVIRTPNMDRLATRGVRVDPFYACPVCSPTRSSLLTGRYNYRTGVVDTYIGRSLMYPDETTIAEVLGRSGYRTGIFGKWHLGDNYPMRPMDQGFHESLVHRGGGIGQPSDPPGGTSYFDPVLFRNGKEEKQTGYVSDVITDAALRFIEESGDRPFFAYLAFNCPHGPLEVPGSYLAMYRDRDLSPTRFPAGGHPVPPWNEKLSETTARIYGMVTHIDDNLGRVLRKLAMLGMSERTLVVFLTDNGPQQPRWNAGMLQRKGSVHEGGIRVPCFWYWPGTLAAGGVVGRPGAHIDVLPTILDAVGIAVPESARLDGRSLWPLIAGTGSTWPDRPLFFQWHRGNEPELGRCFAVRDGRHKLVQPSGVEGGPIGPVRLYDLLQDPLEERDLAAASPEIVARLKATYERWFREVAAERRFVPPRIVVDGVHEVPCVLTRQDWRGPGAGWAPGDVGHWEIDIQGPPGAWNVTLRFDRVVSPSKARLRLGALETSLDLDAGRTSCTFEGIALPAGAGSLEAWIDTGGKRAGVHQVELARS